MASDTSLVFNLIARDQVSGQLRGVEGRFGRLRETMKGLVGPAALLGGVHMLAGFISDARESQKISKLTEQVIKSTGGAAHITASQVGDLATAISNKTGADDEAVQSGANLLLTFTNIRNEAGKGNDVFNQTTQAATDMAAAMNDGKVTQEGVKSASMMLGKALNDPIAGMSKLTKNGVSFTQQQKDQVKALVESGDTLGAQKLILAEVNKEFGGAAEAASSPMDKLKTSVGNLGETIGGALLPFVDSLTKKLTGIVNFVTDNSDWLLPLVGAVAGLAGTIWLIVKATQAWTAIQGAFNIIMAMNPVVLITLAIIALIAVIVLIATKTTWFQTIWKTVWGAIKTAFWAVVNWIKNTAIAVWNAIRDGFKAATNAISAAVTWVKDKFVAFWNRLKSGFTNIKNAIVNAFKAAWDWVNGKITWIRDKFSALGSRIRSIFSTAKTNLVNNFRAGFDWVKGKIDWIIGIFRGIPGRISRAVGGAFNGFKNAFRNAINWIVGKWNGLSFTLPSVTIFGKKIGGGTISTPNIPYLAKGGTLTSGGSVMVGEKGPEMLSLPKGAQVNPLSRSGGSGGPQSLTIKFEKSGDPVLDALMDIMRDKIRVQYGGNVQDALGRR